MNPKFTAMLRASVLAFTSAGMPVPVTAAPPKPYPLTVCLVTGNPLGEMGKAVAKVHNGREIRLCCTPCLEKFDADPAKYMAKLK